MFRVLRTFTPSPPAKWSEYVYHLRLNMHKNPEHQKIAIFEQILKQKSILREALGRNNELNELAFRGKTHPQNHETLERLFPRRTTFRSPTSACAQWKRRKNKKMTKFCYCARKQVNISSLWGKKDRVFQWRLPAAVLLQKCAPIFGMLNSVWHPLFRLEFPHFCPSVNFRFRAIWKQIPYFFWILKLP